jgi:hypothetical protein
MVVRALDNGAFLFSGSEMKEILPEAIHSTDILNPNLGGGMRGARWSFLELKCTKERNGHLALNLSGSSDKTLMGSLRACGLDNGKVRHELCYI